MRQFATALRVPRMLAAACAVALTAALASPVAAANLPPRIVRAVMADADRDDKADRVVLTYSETVRHAYDADGSYPFKVGTYTIRSVSAADGRTIVVRFAERARKDIHAAPKITYTRVTVDRVLDTAGLQAAAQTYSETVPLDRDADGYAAKDCAPAKPAIHPGANDRPDLKFTDANCDGIDGNKKLAVFVSPLGSDANAGTMAAPKASMGAALIQAAESAADDDVFMAAGLYGEGSPQFPAGIGVFGGYDGTTWARSRALETKISVDSTGARVQSNDVTLQLLTIESAHASAAAQSSVALLVTYATNVRLQGVVLRAGGGGSGQPGQNGEPGSHGVAGDKGGEGSCGGSFQPGGGSGGEWWDDNLGGGSGGHGGPEGDNDGIDGDPSTAGVPGGPGGDGGDPGKPGSDGDDGGPGASGHHGASGFPRYQSTGYAPSSGQPGGNGVHGPGGGGGGGGGGQGCYTCNDGSGNAGGGGGSGGRGGTLGTGGQSAGGSFALYSWSSIVTVGGASQFITTGGGSGGDGGIGGAGGPGGPGGPGGTTCTSEVGAGGIGGDGGPGGSGGHGGGGAGGPSIGIVDAAGSVTYAATTVFTLGSGGPGGKSQVPIHTGPHGETVNVKSIPSS